MVNQDRRRFIRIPAENIIAYSVLKDDGGIDMAHSGYVHSRNISQGGILFTAFESFNIKTRVQMKLRIDTDASKDENVGMIGEVVRCEKLPVGQKWDIAVHIKYIEQTKIETFIHWLHKKIGN
ncbi:MAG: PilZ domain-containing protein [Candidatus Aureabacteria bacterium]|nr:PilZ domain-containing protein [Candidatus Auribacterota bacterium]